MNRLNSSVLLLALMLPLAAIADGMQGHCRKGEQVVFNCHIKQKVLSLCMVSPRAGDAGYMQYRFGYLNRPEMVYPKGIEPTGNNFYFSSTTYSAGWESRIRFAVDRYNYLIYAKTTSGPPEKDGVREKGASAGIMIFDHKKPVATLQCLEKDREFDFPEGFVQEEEFDYDPETP